MNFKILLLSHHFITVFATFQIQKTTCLSGYMTDRQKWVNEYGSLTKITDIPETIDVSKRKNPITALHEFIIKLTGPINTIKYFSMAHCDLKVVPDLNILINLYGQVVHLLIENLTLYGNRFDSRFYGNYENGKLTPPTQIEEPEPQWSDPFRKQYFYRLRELDLRACSIEVLDNQIFVNMPRLVSLYLGENRIQHVKPYAFEGLNNLVHLDLSRNIVADVTNGITFHANTIFKNIETLESLDFSYTKLMEKNMLVLRKLTKTMKSLSLCESGLTKLDPYIFNGTSMTILDVSGNPGILQDPETLFGIESSLQILYASNVNLKSFEVFKGLNKLVVLKLCNNDLSFLRPETASSLSSLRVLDLDTNRLTTWQTATFSNIKTLEFLSLKRNNINYLSEKIIDDLSDIKYLGLMENKVVCNCYARTFISIAHKNDLKTNDNDFLKQDKSKINIDGLFHIAFDEFNSKISNRVKVSEYFNDQHDFNENKNVSGNFVLYDYSPNDYRCFLPKEGTLEPYYKSQCEVNSRGDYTEELQLSLIEILLIPGVLVPILVLTFVYRRYIQYCFITLRNTALIGMMHKRVDVDDGTIFNYDVFVSYCHEDRAWVLDDFLPNIERNSGISVCLHERDFQVGLSILENIVSCMDRSRSIMLILSQRFLQSQWCQFEMHLAQHRLLETRREDLILILLEDIPRKLRPNTLHYLMLTKTYIVWPTDETQRSLFWKRLEKSIVKQKIKYCQNESLV